MYYKLSFNTIFGIYFWFQDDIQESDAESCPHEEGDVREDLDETEEESEDSDESEGDDDEEDEEIGK